MSRRAAVLALVGLVAFGAALAALPAQATWGGRTTADEPQYLLTATSLWEDHDLDIADELSERRWLDFHDAALPRQTEPRPDGSELSPHDPLLPLLLAAPVGLAGWVGAKVALAAVAGALAALLVWTATERFAVPLGPAALVVGAFAVVPPLTTYGAQVYPELPAALAVAMAAAALTGPLTRTGARVAWGLAVIALPWLGIKYAPVAAVLAALGLWALGDRAGGRLAAAVAAAGLALAGLAYGAAHRALYGGWTVYAAGDHFVGGELTVVGTSPDYPGRSVRLLGLLLDRHFGLAAWAPGFLLAVPALAWLLRRRPSGWAVLVLPLAAGWANATWVALTMHGWWWPGRQVVVVVPLIVLAVAVWAGADRRRLTVVAAAGVAGLLLWWSLLGPVLAGDARLVIDVDRPRGALAEAWRWLLPDLRHDGPGTTVRLVGWALALALAAFSGAAPTVHRQPAVADAGPGLGPSPDADPDPNHQLEEEHVPA